MNIVKVGGCLTGEKGHYLPSFSYLIWFLRELELRVRVFQAGGGAWSFFFYPFKQFHHFIT